MDIKKPDKPPKSIKTYFSSRKRIIRSFWQLCILVGAIVIFFGVLGLGAFQNKTVAETFYRPALYKIAHLDFSNIKDMIDGKSNGFDQLQIKMNPKDLLKIQQAREKVANKGLSLELLEGENFPAALSYKGKIHNIRIRGEASVASIIKESPGWSFKVDDPIDNTMEGRIQFHLMPLSTGEYLTSWLATDLMKEREVKSLKGDFVNVAINGSPAGIYYMEERFDNDQTGHELPEVGIFFKIEDDEIVFYKNNEQGRSPKVTAQMLELTQKWRNVIDGNISVEKFFDLRQTGKLIAHLDLANQQHPFQREKVLFLYNPIRGLAEPIASNLGHLEQNSYNAMELFVESPRSKNHGYLRSPQDAWVQMIHSSIDFNSSYLSEAELISQKSVIDRLLIRNGDRLNYLLEKVYYQWPAYELPTAALYGKAKYMRSVLFPDIPEIIAHLNHKTKDYLEIHLQNLQDLPVEVTSISWRDSIFFYPQKTILLPPNDKEKKQELSLFKFQIPNKLILSDTLISELLVNHAIPGLQSGNKSVLLFPWPQETSQVQFQNPAVRKPNYNTFEFVEERPDGKTITIRSGVWTLSRDLIIPKDKHLQIEAGAQIDLTNHAKIISYSPIFCSGQEGNPIEFKSSDDTGQGLVVIQAQQLSKLSYTNFGKLSNPKDTGWQLSGSVTFYESPVEIRFCQFSENLRGDDFLNIVRANFDMDQVIFKNILADAFDCDFCEGTIKNASFSNVGNDGVDISGSTIDVSHVFMEFIGDKGLSAGEDSELRAAWIEINNAEIGVTSKDRSRVYLSDSKLINAKVAITLFEKKSEFGPSFMSAERVSVERSEIPYLVEQNSKLTVDGNLMSPSRDNVKEILYGAEYGKSSK